MVPVKFAAFEMVCPLIKPEVMVPMFTRLPVVVALPLIVNPVIEVVAKVTAPFTFKVPPKVTAPFK